MNWFNFLHFYKYVYFTHETFVNRTQCISYCQQNGGHLVPYSKIYDMQKIFADNNILKEISDQIGKVLQDSIIKDRFPEFRCKTDCSWKNRDFEGKLSIPC